MRKNLGLVVMATIFILCVGVSHVAAADYPTKPITKIVTVPPGGAADVQARAFGSVAEKFLGQPVVVVNKVGAGGMIGMLACAQAAPDGYTLVSASALAVLPIEWEIVNGRKPPVTEEDFVKIGGISQTRYMITVAYNSPWKTLADFINDAKANPGKYAFGSNSLHGNTHLCTEVFMASTGLKFRHVPYAGGGPAVSALVGNHIDFAVTTAGSSVPLVRGNKLRYLAVLGDKRYKFMADIPSTKELGIEAEFLSNWLGVWAPQKTPMPIVEKLREVTKKVVEDKSFINITEDLGEEAVYMEGEEISKFVASDKAIAKKIYSKLLAEEKK